MNTEISQIWSCKVTFIMDLKGSVDTGSNSHPFNLVAKLQFIETRRTVLSLDTQYLIYLCLSCSGLSGVTVLWQMAISNIFKFLRRNH